MTRVKISRHFIGAKNMRPAGCLQGLRQRTFQGIRTAGHHRGKYRPQDDQQSQNQEKCKLLMGKEEIFLFHRICSFARILGSTAP